MDVPTEGDETEVPTVDKWSDDGYSEESDAPTSTPTEVEDETVAPATWEDDGYSAEDRGNEMRMRSGLG